MQAIPLVMHTERLMLRPVERSDAADIFLYASQPEVQRWTQSIPSPYTRKDALSFIRMSQRALDAQTGFYFSVLLKKEVLENGTNDSRQQCIGVVDLHSVNWQDKHAQLGYGFNKKYWGKGYGSEAARAVVSFGFRYFKLHRIAASCFEQNTASSRLLEKIGMKKEGLSRHTHFRRGEWHNTLLYAILKSEWTTNT